MRYSIALTMTLGLAIALLAARPAGGETIRMEQLDVEGEVHKPEVMFILERTQKTPRTPGVERLRSSLLPQIVKDGLEYIERQNLENAAY